MLYGRETMYLVRLILTHYKLLTCLIMKKFMYVFVIFCGLASIAAMEYKPKSTSDLVAQKTWEIKVENSMDTAAGLCCTTTVTFNGAPHASFTDCTPGFACVIARGMACEYITNQGGTCPQQ